MQIVFLFYEGMTTLDAIGPHEVLCRLPNASIKRVAKQAGAIATDSTHLTLIAEHGLSDVSYADVLVVPGAGSATTLHQHPDILDWLRAIHTTTTWTTSVCTGSLILGAADILKGLRATSHWATLDRLPIWGAVPVSERVVEDGKVITAAGVSAGIDMALLLAAKLAGQAVAERIQLGIEYDPQPPFDVGSVAKAKAETVAALKERFAKTFESVKNLTL